MNIVLLGPPGSGKGTQSQRLQEKYGFRKIATGDLIRAEIAADTDLGRQLAGIIERGAFPEDSVVLYLIGTKIEEASQGVILDGFPRTQEQARHLDSLLHQKGQRVDLAIEFMVEQRILAERIVGRLSCPICGAVYNDTLAPPQKEGFCDRCQDAHLSRRSDDVVSTVVERLRVYQEKTAPLVAYYLEQGCLEVVDGMRSMEKIEAQIEALISKHKSVQTEDRGQRTKDSKQGERI